MLTDHYRYTDTRMMTEDTFIMVQGTEITGYTTNGKQIHFNVFWEDGQADMVPSQTFELKDGMETRKLCDELRDKGCYLMLNHPHWSQIISSDVEDDNHYHAIEIYN